MHQQQQHALVDEHFKTLDNKQKRVMLQSDNTRPTWTSTGRVCGITDLVLPLSPTTKISGPPLKTTSVTDREMLEKKVKTVGNLEGSRNQ
uniref:Uncharacterized protein n=1 Tax=Mesocestoides corti TaxID=53468 RepID=A0A5K3ET44_MESCO